MPFSVATTHTLPPNDDIIFLPPLCDGKLDRPGPVVLDSPSQNYETALSFVYLWSRGRHQLEVERRYRGGGERETVSGAFNPPYL